MAQQKSFWSLTRVFGLGYIFTMLLCKRKNKNLWVNDLIWHCKIHLIIFLVFWKDRAVNSTGFGNQSLRGRPRPRGFYFCDEKNLTSMCPFSSWVGLIFMWWCKGTQLLDCVLDKLDKWVDVFIKWILATMDKCLDK